MTNISSGMESNPITTDHANRPHGKPVTSPCMSIVVATKTMKNCVQSIYDDSGKSPCASSIQDTSQENAPK